jgi:hypothetical protein
VGLLACADGDGDGVGSARDCDDAAATAYPGGVEVCDGLDNDCDGNIDEGVATLVWLDADGDGFGDAARARRVCEVPSNSAANADDCDDADAGASPAGVEACDGADNDCNGAADDGVGSPFWPDSDGDGFAASTDGERLACERPEGFAGRVGDCDDADPSAHGADGSEVCDGLDNDCDGAVDEGLLVQPWPIDRDGDGVGGETTQLGCAPDAAAGAVAEGGDCDDSDADVAPGLGERVATPYDDDCDGYVSEIEVPTSQPTVQAALAVASDGDVVQIVGLVEEDVDLRGHDVTLAGEGCARSALLGTGLGTVVTTDGAGIADLTISGGTASGVVVEGVVAVTRACIEGNTAPSHGGGVLVADAASLTLTDSRVWGNSAGLLGEGGGLAVGHRATWIADRVDFRDNSAYYGGAFSVRSGFATVSHAVVAGNSTSWDGAGVFVRHLRDVTGAAPPTLSVDQSTFVANFSRGDLAATSTTSVGEGPALRVSDDLILGNNAVVSVSRSIFVGHGETVEPVLYGDNDNISVVGNGFVGNTGRDHRQGWDRDAVRGPASFFDAAWALGASARPWDLRLLPGSSFVDVGPAYDADGSLADLGAYGGLGAAPDASVHADADGDGLPDLWELAYGGQPWLANDAEDRDGDGLSEAEEFAERGDPRLADTDGDGLSDGEEVAARGGLGAGWRVDAAWDRAAVIVVDAPVYAALNEPLRLDATATAAGDGAATSVVTACTGAPLGGTPPPAGTTGLDFVPDAPGVWTFTVTATTRRGALTASAQQVVQVEVLDAIVVPDDIPTLAAALAAVSPGGAIALRPGSYPAITVRDRNLTLFGLVRAAEVVEIAGAPGQPAVTVSDTTPDGATDTDPWVVRLSRLSVVDGRGADGGGLACVDVDLVVDDVRFQDNETAGEGGGLSLLRCDLDARDILFLNNRARNGAGLYAEMSDVRIDRLIALDNVASDKGGVAWYGLDDDPQTFLVRAARLQGNVAADGAVVWYQADDDPDRFGAWQNVVAVANATAVPGVGAIFRAREGRLQLIDAVVAYNHAGTIWNGNGADEDLVDLVWFGNVGTSFDAEAPVPRGLDTSPVTFVAWSDDGDADNDVCLVADGRAEAGLPDVFDPDGSRASVGWGGPWGGGLAALGVRDSDADGIADGWEFAFFGALTPDATSDFDGDGASDRSEYLASSDPMHGP